LHAAGPNLERIHLIDGILGILGLEDLGNDREPDFTTRCGQELDTIATQASKSIRSGAGLVRPTSENGSTGLGHGMSRGEHLLFRFNRTGTSNHRERVVPESNAADLDHSCGCTGDSAGFAFHVVRLLDESV
jgi:hypothetical protein